MFLLQSLGATGARETGGAPPAGGRTGQQAASRSFEEVLRQRAVGEPAGPSQSSGTSGADLEQLRLHLVARYRQLSPGQSGAGELVPEGRLRLQLLREAMEGLRVSPRGLDVRGRFGQIEAEWQEVEKIMRSSRDLSQGELLGLQARLYQVSQHIEIMSKVVDQMTGGIRTILNTNV